MFLKTMPALFASLLLALVAALGPDVSAQADPRDEIVAVRSRIAAAVAAKDRAALDRLFTSDYTHTHAVGRMDDRARRLGTLASGEATVDSVEPDEMVVRFYGDDRATAIAVGRSTVGDFEYRWTVVYIKGPAGWQVAARHASEVLE